MKTEKGRTRQRLKDISHMKEEKAGCDFINASEEEENSREVIAEEMATTTADGVGTCKSILINPNNTKSSSDNTSSKDTHFSKPSLSYIALIAKVILSSPSQKLNLASIYRAMEEQFPYLRSRGPGWRNSVRHNLSVNDCFVKVSRCEDGRGHYWGVHHAHLRDFQQGNFRQSRKTRGRRERECYNEVAGYLAWIKTSSLMESIYKSSRSSSCVAPQCPLQEPLRYQLSSLGWTHPHYLPWSASASWVHPPGWMKLYYFPERLTDSSGRATSERRHTSQPMTSRLNSWDVTDPALTGSKESYESRFLTPPVQALTLPGCWCMTPVIKELKKPLPYKVRL